MGTEDLTVSQGPLAREELELVDAYWRAANYLSVGQIYLLDNPLLGARSGSWWSPPARISRSPARSGR